MWPKHIYQLILLQKKLKHAIYTVMTIQTFLKTTELQF